MVNRNASSFKKEIQNIKPLTDLSAGVMGSYRYISFQAFLLPKSQKDEPFESSSMELL